MRERRPRAYNSGRITVQDRNVGNRAEIALLPISTRFAGLRSLRTVQGNLWIQGQNKKGQIMNYQIGFNGAASAELSQLLHAIERQLNGLGTGMLGQMAAQAQTTTASTAQPSDPSSSGGHDVGTILLAGAAGVVIGGAAGIVIGYFMVKGPHH
jgi:hypothetical protein